MARAAEGSTSLNRAGLLMALVKSEHKSLPEDVEGCSTGRER